MNIVHPKAQKNKQCSSKIPKKNFLLTVYGYVKSNLIAKRGVKYCLIDCGGLDLKLGSPMEALKSDWGLIWASNSHKSDLLSLLTGFEILVFVILKLYYFES